MDRCTASIDTDLNTDIVIRKKFGPFSINEDAIGQQLNFQSSRRISNNSFDPWMKKRLPAAKRNPRIRDIFQFINNLQHQGNRKVFRAGSFRIGNVTMHTGKIAARSEMKKRRPDPGRSISDGNILRYSKTAVIQLISDKPNVRLGRFFRNAVLIFQIERRTLYGFPPSQKTRNFLNRAINAYPCGLSAMEQDQTIGCFLNRTITEKWKVFLNHCGYSRAQGVGLHAMAGPICSRISSLV